MIFSRKLVTLCLLFLCIDPIAFCARIQARNQDGAKKRDNGIIQQLSSVWGKLAGMDAAPASLDFAPLLAAYRCSGPNLAHVDSAHFNYTTDKLDSWSCQGANDPARVASAGLFLASSASAMAGVAGMATTLQITSSIVGLWADIPGIEDVQQRLAAGIEELAVDLKTFRFERGLATTVAKSRVLSDRTRELRHSPVLMADECQNYGTAMWFSSADRTDEDAQYALANTLTYAKLFMETIKVDQAINLNIDLLKRNLQVADGLSNVWTSLAMGRLNFLTLVSEHSGPCEELYKNSRYRIRHSLLNSSVVRFRRFSNVWTTHREALKSGMEALTLEKIKEMLQPNSLGKRSLTNIARAAPQLLRMGEEGQEILRDLLKCSDLAVVSAALELRNTVTTRGPPELLLPFTSELVDIVDRPAEGTLEEQFYADSVEVEAARLLEVLSKQHAAEIGWDDGKKLRKAMSEGIIRGQQARTIIGTVIQRIAASDPQKSMKHKRPRDGDSLLQLVSEDYLATMESSRDDGLSQAIQALSNSVTGFAAVDTVDLWGLLDTFNCEGDGKGDGSFECAGANDFASIASAGLLLASAVASASGFGLPVASVLSIASTIVGLWASSGPTLPEFQHDVLLMLREAVDQVKQFHHQFDLAEALSKSIVLEDHIDFLRDIEPIEHCDSPVAVSHFRSIDRVDEITAEAMEGLLTEAELAAKTMPDKEFGVESLKKRVELLDGFTNAWTNLAMGRLKLLVEGQQKSANCDRFKAAWEFRMRYTVLGSALDRYRQHNKQVKIVRSAYMESIYEFEVQDIRTALGDWFYHTWDPDAVATYAPQLVQMGKAGRSLLREFFQHSWAIRSGALNEDTVEVLKKDQKLIILFSPDLAQLLLISWKDAEGEDLKQIRYVHKVVAKLLDMIPMRHIPELKSSKLEQTLNEVIDANPERWNKEAPDPHALDEKVRKALVRVLDRLYDKKNA